MDRRLGAVAAFLLVVGTASALTGAYLIYQEERALSDVRSTNGTVVSVGVERVESGGEATYYPNVTYRYSVDGEEYTSRDLFPPADQRRGSDEDWARGVASNYRKGEGVTVYYREDDPAAATLRQNRTTGPYMALWLGGVGAAFGVLFGAGAIQRGDDPEERTNMDEEVRID